MEVDNDRKLLVLVLRNRVWEEESEKGFGFGVKRDVLGESE